MTAAIVWRQWMVRLSPLRKWPIAVVVPLALAPVAAYAGWGNPSYLNILKASNPTGYMATPTAYDLSTGSKSISFTGTVTNLTNSSQSVAVHFSIHHIRTFQGVDVSDGQPGQPGITEQTFMDAFASSPPPPGSQDAAAGKIFYNLTFAPGESRTLTFGSLAFPQCGYYEVDVVSNDSVNILMTGFARVLGCQAAVAPTPTPTGSTAPAGGGNQGQTATPAPTGAAAAAATTQTSGGSVSGQTATLAPTGAAGAAVGLPSTGMHAEAQPARPWGLPAALLAVIAMLSAIGWLLWRRRASSD